MWGIVPVRPWGPIGGHARCILSLWNALRLLGKYKCRLGRLVMASRSCSSLGPLTNRVCAILTTSPTKKLNRWSGVPSVRPAHPRAKRQRTMGRGQSLGIRRLAVPRAGGISHPELEEQRIGIQPTKIDLDYQPRSSLRFFVRPHVLHASERSSNAPPNKIGVIRVMTISVPHSGHVDEAFSGSNWPAT